jgi:hypothetical protein
VLRCGVTVSEGEAFVLQAVPPSTGVFLTMSPSSVALPHSLRSLGPFATDDVLRDTMKGALCIVHALIFLEKDEVFVCLSPVLKKTELFK